LVDTQSDTDKSIEQSANSEKAAVHSNLFFRRKQRSVWRTHMEVHIMTNMWSWLMSLKLF